MIAAGALARRMSKVQLAIMHRLKSWLIFLPLLGASAPFSAFAAGRPGDVFVASHQLGFSGAVVTVREDYRATKWPAAHRTFVLRGAGGKTASLALADGGVGNDDLSLYSGRDRFFLIGAVECIEFDPIKVKVGRCRVEPPCETGLRVGVLHLGRFSWANGFDPPKGRFDWRWRFLPFEDGSEQSFCPRPGV
ncbi:MAG: hypothetical protein QM608_04830 [Caulobacter sp.]